MIAPDTAEDGLPARSVFRTMTVAPSRRRTPLQRAKRVMRSYAGLGACMAMLIASAALVVLAR